MQQLVPSCLMSQSPAFNPSLTASTSRTEPSTSPAYPPYYYPPPNSLPRTTTSQSSASVDTAVPQYPPGHPLAPSQPLCAQPHLQYQQVANPHVQPYQQSYQVHGNQYPPYPFLPPPPPGGQYYIQSGHVVLGAVENDAAAGQQSKGKRGNGANGEGGRTRKKRARVVATAAPAPAAVQGPTAAPPVPTSDTVPAIFGVGPGSQGPSDPPAISETSAATSSTTRESAARDAWYFLRTLATKEVPQAENWPTGPEVVLLNLHMWDVRNCGM
jgi:hypothetical protein